MNTSKPFKLFIIASGIIFLSIVVIAILEKHEDKTVKFKKDIKSWEHVEAARVAIEEGREADAFMHLDKVNRMSEAWNSGGKALWDKIGPYIVKQKKKSEELIKKQTAKLRRDFARNYENKLLDRGMNVYVSTSGLYHEVLEIKYVLVSRPLAHNFSKDTNMMSILYNKGFDKVILKDGHGSEFTIIPHLLM